MWSALQLLLHGALAADVGPPAETAQSTTTGYVYQGIESSVTPVAADDPTPAMLVGLHLKNVMEDEGPGWMLRLLHILSAEKVAQEVSMAPDDGVDVLGGDEFVNDLLAAGEVYSVVFLAEKSFSSSVIDAAGPSSFGVFELRNVTIWLRDAAPTYAQTLHEHSVPRRAAKSCVGRVTNGKLDVGLQSGCLATMASAVAATASAVPIDDAALRAYAAKGNVQIVASEQASDTVDFADLWDETAELWADSTARVAVTNFFLLKFALPGGASETWRAAMCASPRQSASGVFKLCAQSKVSGAACASGDATIALGGDSPAPRTKSRARGASSSASSSRAAVAVRRGDGGGGDSSESSSAGEGEGESMLQTAQRMLRDARGAGQKVATASSLTGDDDADPSGESRSWSAFIVALVKLALLIGLCAGAAVFARRRCAAVASAPLAASERVPAASSSGFARGASSYGSG